MSKITYETINITPAMAKRMLAESGGNRPLRAEHIAFLASQLRRGEWEENGQSIVFDVDGLLVNGHHRLNAVVAADLPAKFLVVRGVSKSAVFTIDSVVPRDLGDQLTFNGGTNSKTRASYLASCVRLVAGFSVTLKTVEDYRAWGPHFHDGTEAFMGMELKGRSHLRRATVAGPLILAHRIEPVVVEKLFLQLRDGEDLKGGTAAHTLREYLIFLTSADRRDKDTGDLMAGKIFSAVLAHVKGRPLKKLQYSSEAVDTVRKLYSRGNVGKLVADAKAMRQAARRLVEAVKPGEPGKAVTEEKAA